MHDISPVEFHKEVVDLRKQESKLKKSLSIPRRKLDRERLVESLVAQESLCRVLPTDNLDCLPVSIRGTRGREEVDVARRRPGTCSALHSFVCRYRQRPLLASPFGD
jgi:hypothetical protein